MEKKKDKRIRKLNIFLTLVFLLLMTLLLYVIPFAWMCGESFFADSRYGMGLFRDNAVLFPLSLALVLFLLSMLGFCVYGIYRLVRPAGQPRLDAGKLRRYWGWAGLAGFAVNVFTLVWNLRPHSPPEVSGNPANGGTYTTASDIFAGEAFLFVLVLSLDCVIFSLIRRRELKRLLKQGEGAQGLQ